MSSPYLPAPPLLSYPIPIDPSLQSVGSSLGNLGRQQFHSRQLAEEYSPSPSLAMSPILSTLPEAFASNAADCVTGSALYDVSPSVPGASNKLIPEVQLPPMSTISIPFTSTVLAPMSIRYLFPNPQPPPPPPTKPYLMQADGKATKSEICQEFVAVETYTQKLLHDVTVLAKENQIMKEYLGSMPKRRLALTRVRTGIGPPSRALVDARMLRDMSRFSVVALTDMLFMALRYTA
ncbi:hypothetical protein HHX47_DHR3000417 [Lentinula edodes]|nr:hypothetical protein HHX47_DHR3000417 [Lentinula edodes]